MNKFRHLGLEQWLFFVLICTCLHRSLLETVLRVGAQEADVWLFLDFNHR